MENIQRLLSALLYPVGTLRAAPHILAQNVKGSPACGRSASPVITPFYWCTSATVKSPLLSEALQAFNYWRNHHVTINLVILNDQDTGYALDLHNTIQRQIRRMGAETA